MGRSVRHRGIQAVLSGLLVAALAACPGADGLPDEGDVRADLARADPGAPGTDDAAGSDGAAGDGAGDEGAAGDRASGEGAAGDDASGDDASGEGAVDEGAGTAADHAAGDPASRDADPCGADADTPFPVPAGWAAPNAWSWNASWAPCDADFPLAGLRDDECEDLPPGRWDWDDAADDEANWRNFRNNLGDLVPLADACGRAFGWRFVPNEPGAVDWAGPAEHLEGSSGTDLLLLGGGSTMHSITAGLAGGPDVLVFEKGYAMDFAVGVQGVPGDDRDDDLVVAGCEPNAGADLSEAALYDLATLTIHAGPGRDLVFATDIRASAIDGGNGAGGDTGVLDPADGDDVVVLRGSVKDLRVFGGVGDDVVFWHVDGMREATTYQGGDLFGGGGYGDAIWGDPGTDRLVLVVPADTALVDAPPAPAGGVLVWTPADYDAEPWWDEPTLHDPKARYCITCGIGPAGQRTQYVEYVSADGTIRTGYVSVTAFEELQLGIGAGARVFRIDTATGRATAAPDLAALVPPAVPTGICDPR